MGNRTDDQVTHMAMAENSGYEHDCERMAAIMNNHFSAPVEDYLKAIYD